MASMTIASFKPIFSGLQFEFDESEEWDSSMTATNDEVAVSEASWSKVVKGGSSMVDQVAVTAVKTVATVKAVATVKSPPMKIPDWRRILGVAYEDHRARQQRDYNVAWAVEDGDEDEDEDDEYFGLPPHEYLARTRGASLSGRSLKGRDLWRLRNAIWKRIGFED